MSVLKPKANFAPVFQYDRFPLGGTQVIVVAMTTTMTSSPGHFLPTDRLVFEMTQDVELYKERVFLNVIH